MKKSVILFVSVFVIVVITQNAKAQNTQSAQSQASANIISPMTISNNLPLSFGNIAAGSASGKVELETNGNRIATNVILPSVTGTVSAAKFTVTGLAGSSYVLTLPGSTTLTSGSATMTIDNFESTATEVLTAGTEEFFVGATINIAANQTVGLYEGSFTVTVDYE